MAIKYKLNGSAVTREELSASVDKSKLMEVLLERKFPGIQDDTTFVSGRGTLLDQLGEDQTELVVSEARKKGYNPSANDIYLSGIAKEIGDPAAFIKQDGAKGQVRKVCEKRGWQCDGSVKVNPSKREDGDPGFVRPSLEDCKQSSLATRQPIRVSS